MVERAAAGRKIICGTFSARWVCCFCGFDVRPVRQVMGAGVRGVCVMQEKICGRYCYTS